MHLAHPGSILLFNDHIIIYLNLKISLIFASFVVDVVAVLGLAWHFGVSFECLQYTDMFEQLMG